MDPNHIATKGDLQDVRQEVSDLKEMLRQALGLTAAEDFLTLEEAAKATKTTPKTVRKWIEEGKPDQKGNIIKLQALEFSPGFKRIPRAALLAYGQGLGFDVSRLLPEHLPPMRRVA
ncbi:MAG TPA: helix-turn-helix domain-containing protein [Hymenobacter sp.]|jgi:hypothetical protein